MRQVFSWSGRFHVDRAGYAEMHVQERVTAPPPFKATPRFEATLQVEAVAVTISPCRHLWHSRPHGSLSVASRTCRSAVSPRLLASIRPAALAPSHRSFPATVLTASRRQRDDRAAGICLTLTPESSSLRLTMRQHGKRDLYFQHPARNAAGAR